MKKVKTVKTKSAKPVKKVKKIAICFAVTPAQLKKITSLMKCNKYSKSQVCSLAIDNL